MLLSALILSVIQFLVPEIAEAKSQDYKHAQVNEHPHQDEPAQFGSVAVLFEVGAEAKKRRADEHA